MNAEENKKRIQFNHRDLMFKTIRRRAVARLASTAPAQGPHTIARTRLRVGHDGIERVVHVADGVRRRRRPVRRVVRRRRPVVPFADGRGVCGQRVAVVAAERAVGPALSAERPHDYGPAAPRVLAAVGAVRPAGRPPVADAQHAGKVSVTRAPPRPVGSAGPVTTAARRRMRRRVGRPLAVVLDGFPGRDLVVDGFRAVDVPHVHRNPHEHSVDAENR